MEDTGINPYKYGKMVAQVESMEKKIDKLETSMEELLGLANRSRGGLWTGMIIVSSISAIIGYITSHWVTR